MKAIRFQDSKIVQYVEFLKSDTNFDLLISRLPDIKKKVCTRNGAMDPSFQLKYVQAFQIFYCHRNCRNSKCEVFFETPCMCGVIFYLPQTQLSFGSQERLRIWKDSACKMKPQIFLCVSLCAVELSIYLNLYLRLWHSQLSLLYHQNRTLNY